jgi:hypothetical protein
MSNLRRLGSRVATLPRLTGVLALSVGLLAACGDGSDAGTQRTSTSDSGRARAMAVQAAAADEIKVVELAKVSEVRVSRTVFDYTFQVQVRNTGRTAYENVVLTLTAVGAGASVRDGSVALGRIAAGVDMVTSDTVTIRQERTQTFDAAALAWRIEGTAVTSPQAQLAALEASGAIPALERGSTLAGIDANGNGVRDDVEAYISAQYGEASQRAAAMQVARALQAALFVNVQDVAAAKEVSRKVTHAANCVFSRFPGPPGSKDPARVIKELEGVTANTKPRLLAYLAYNKALDGTSSALPEGDTCE